MATKIHGIAASENLDTSGERIIVSGLDISSLESDGVFNWEHKSDQPTQVVGKILKAKKIYSAADCANEDESYFWERCQVPFVYVMGELMDDYKDSAKEVAAHFRYDADHKDRDIRGVSNFSIEGARIEKKGMDITRSIARKVTITVHPCNKAAVAELKRDEDSNKNENLSSIFKTEANVEIQLFKSEGDRLTEIMNKQENPAEHAKILGIIPMSKPGQAPAPAGVNAKRAAPAPQGQEQAQQKGQPGQQKPQQKQSNVLQHPVMTAGHGFKLGMTTNGKEIMSHKRVHEYGPMSSKDHTEAASLHFKHAESAKDPVMGRHHMDKVRLHMQAARTSERREALLSPPQDQKIVKSLDAGSMMAAPGNLTGGAALQRESLEGHDHSKSAGWNKTMTKRKQRLAKAEEEYQCWEKKEAFQGFMSHKFPSMTKGEIDAIGRAIALKQGLKSSKNFKK